MFKVKLIRFFDLSVKSFLQFSSWLKATKSYIVTDPNHRIAEVCNSRDEVCAYVPFEQCFLLGSMAVSPHVSYDECKVLGNVVDSEFNRLAQSAQVTKIFITLPADAPREADEIRIVPRTIPQMATTHKFLQQFAPSAPKCLVN